MTWDLPLANRRLWLWAAIVAVSLTFRLVAASLLEGRSPNGDVPHYLAIAQNLIAGDGVVVDDPHNEAVMRVTYPPFYPMLLAVVGLVFPLTFLVIAFFNTVIDVACAWLMARLGSRLAQGDAGLVAAAAYLLWPTHVGMAPLARKEGLVALLLVSLLLLLVQLGKRITFRAVGLYGLISALLALTQPGLFFLPALLAIAAIPEFGNLRRWFGAMVAAAFVAALAIMPWTIRNWLLFQQFIPLTNAGGYGLWVGATPDGDGRWLLPPERFRTGDELGMSAALREEAWRIIKADPLGYLLHCLQKIPRALILEDRGAAMLHWAEPRAYYLLTGVWTALATLAQVVVLQAAAVTSIVRRNELLSRFLFAGLAQILLFGMWFEFDQRHRYFLTPILLLVAARGVQLILERRSGDRVRLAT